MIITREKPIEEIYQMLEPHNKILIIGCDGCFQPPRGLKEAKVQAKLLELKRKIEKKEFKAKTATVLRQCDEDILISTLRPILDNEDFDAILSMACGAGVQTVAALYEIPVYPAQNTLFIGSKMEGGLYEMCNACGDCLLGYTGGVCPVANCAKGLMNGPCGGQVEGMCEVGDYTKKCAWVEIWKKLKDRPGGLELFRRYREPRDHRLMTSPREEKEEAIEIE
ncbi:MAG: hypothetical protein GF329_21420 [Candidatus Lokiarchaeota archaeon]|nr:hypothetical protein [Candidatus Lokiarchaeota archaeon]